jgi:hypothetical protein
MPLAGTRLLAALALAGLQATAAAAPCGCGQFALEVSAAAPEGVTGSLSQAQPDHGALSPNARRLRDFILFSHRRIGADLIRQRGPYLDTLAAFFPHCTNTTVKLAWLRHALAGTGDTSQFAAHIVHQAENGRACPAAPE